MAGKLSENEIAQIRANFKELDVDGNTSLCCHPCRRRQITYRECGQIMRDQCKVMDYGQPMKLFFI